jgi:hypothetical protein
VCCSGGRPFARNGDGTIEFLLTSLIVVVLPGIGVLSTLAAGLSRGPRASVIAAFACTLGIMPHMAAADREAHEEMSFHEGWGKCADQLAEPAAKL